MRLFKRRRCDQVAGFSANVAGLAQRGLSKRRLAELAAQESALRDDMAMLADKMVVQMKASLRLGSADGRQVP